MHALDLAGEMAASRLRREAATTAAIREARVLAVRCAMRANSRDEDIEGMVLHFYPKLSAEKQADVAAAVRKRGFRSVLPREGAPGEMDPSMAPAELLVLDEGPVEA